MFLFIFFTIKTSCTSTTISKLYHFLYACKIVHYTRNIHGMMHLNDIQTFSVLLQRFFVCFHSKILHFSTVMNIMSLQILVFFMSMQSVWPVTNDGEQKRSQCFLLSVHIVIPILATNYPFATIAATRRG